MKKKAAKRPPPNPSDPNLLARAILEAAIGGPLAPEKTRKKPVSHNKNKPKPRNR